VLLLIRDRQRGTTACDTRQLRLTHLFGARDTFVSDCPAGSISSEAEETLI
jgi:hypothetical protein